MNPWYLLELDSSGHWQGWCSETELHRACGAWHVIRAGSDMGSLEDWQMSYVLRKES